MKAKTAGWASFALSFVALIFALVLPPILGLSHITDNGPLSVQLGIGLAFLMIGFVGALIAVRQPSNRIWWIFSSFALLTLGSNAWQSFAIDPLNAGSHSVPLRVGATISNVIGGPVVIMFLIFLFLLFPDGRPASRRWRPVVIFAVAWCIFFALADLLAPGPLNNLSTSRDVINPFGIGALLPIRSFIWGPAFLMLPILTISGVVSLVMRFRAASSVQRQQIKLFAFAGAIVALTFVAGPIYLWRPNSAPTWGWNVAFMFAVLSIPVAVGAAILRYRLYDIDRLISRTASYLVITIMLAGVFVLLVLVPTTAFGSQTSTPSWVVAMATLAVAVLFQPVRRRVQSVVDRRFNRARYNAVHTIENFSARLRDEIDLETLRTEISTVVSRTMEPASVSVWLRGGTP